jgi:hypothetical protein
MKEYEFRATYASTFTIKAKNEDQATDLARDHATNGDNYVSADGECSSFEVEYEGDLELLDVTDLDEPLFDFGISFIQHPENTPNMGVVHFEDGDKRYFLRYYVLSPSNLEYVGGKEAVAA